MKYPTDYTADVTNAVEAIGKVVGVPVGLYRQVGKAWELLAPANYDSGRLNPYYPYAIYEGVTTQLGMFVVTPVTRTQENPTYEAITSFWMTPFPGCCGLCISTAARVLNPYKSRGINKLGLQLRQAIAGYTGYKGLVCTDVAHNEHSIRTIEGSGFQKLHSFRNKRTANTVNLYLKELD